jgi:hypothetical protein
MFSKILAVIITVLIVLTPVQVAGQEVASLQGKVTSVIKGQEAPYAGTLLDEIASAKMITDKKYAALELELKLRKEFAKEFADKKMSYDILKSDFDSLQKTHTALVEIKEEQITNLNELLKEEMGPDYSSLWFAGGIVVGIIVSVAIFFAATEIKN